MPWDIAQTVRALKLMNKRSVLEEGFSTVQITREMQKWTKRETAVTEENSPRLDTVWKALMLLQGKKVVKLTEGKWYFV